MKRYGDRWEHLLAWPNLVQAARKARRGKRDRPAVQRFEFDLEANLLALRHELSEGHYRPGPFSTHWIQRPKPRMISAAPYRDRVVHHALMNVLEPILDRHFHPDSYACRRGKGTHAAADRLQALMRRRRHLVQCDVRKYFPSLDHEVLKSLFRRLLKDRRLLALMDRIVDHSNDQEPVFEYFPGDDLFTPFERRRGLPIGNLTSQWFANWYLTGLDHYVTSGLGIGGYVRYCDDFILLDDDRRVLREAVGRVRAYLAALRLRLHERRISVRPVRAGARFVGYRVWPTHRLVTKENVHLFRRRVRWMRGAYAAGQIEWPDVKARLASWIGHAGTAHSVSLLTRLSNEWVFVRDGAADDPCVAGRFLEQQPEELPISQPQQEHAGQPEQPQRVSSGRALEGARRAPCPEFRGSRAAGG